MFKEERNRRLIKLYNETRIGAAHRMPTKELWELLGFHGDSSTIGDIVKDELWKVGLLSHPTNGYGHDYIIIYEKDHQLVETGGRIRQVRIER